MEVKERASNNLTSEGEEGLELSEWKSKGLVRVLNRVRERKYVQKLIFDMKALRREVHSQDDQGLSRYHRAHL
jgi:hypothetical protein